MKENLIPLSFTRLSARKRDIRFSQRTHSEIFEGVGLTLSARDGVSRFGEATWMGMMI